MFVLLFMGGSRLGGIIAPPERRRVERAMIAVVVEPTASRPHMPGYGILPADQGRGLLPWSWAVGRLRASHDYWLATTWPDGGAHVMPVWGVWRDDALWFSSSLGSRKARNLAHDSRCVLTTDDARNPVIVEGDAERIGDRDLLTGFNDVVNVKYNTNYTVDFYDPDTNGVWQVRPSWAFGLVGDDFTGSPTRWEFDGSAARLAARLSRRRPASPTRCHASRSTSER